MSCSHILKLYCYALVCHERRRRRKKVYNMPEQLTLIKYRIYPYRHIFTYSLAVYLPLLKGQHGRTGRNKLQPWINNSLTLKLNLCRKRQLNLERISLLKRKVQHRRKRIQRKKHAKVKMQKARFNAPGFFLRRCWCFNLILLAPSFPHKQFVLSVAFNDYPQLSAKIINSNQSFFATIFQFLLPCRRSRLFRERRVGMRSKLAVLCKN